MGTVGPGAAQLAQAIGRIQELGGRLTKDSPKSCKLHASDRVGHKGTSQGKPRARYGSANVLFATSKHTHLMAIL